MPCKHVWVFLENCHLSIPLTKKEQKRERVECETLNSDLDSLRGHGLSKLLELIKTHKLVKARRYHCQKCLAITEKKV